MYRLYKKAKELIENYILISINLKNVIERVVGRIYLLSVGIGIYSRNNIKLFV